MRAFGASQISGPVLNLSVPPEKLPGDHFWKLTGVDGRYQETCRRFPGFKNFTFDYDVTQTRTIVLLTMTTATSDDGGNMFEFTVSESVASVQAGHKVLFNGNNTEYLVVGVDSGAKKVYVYDPDDVLSEAATAVTVLDASPWDVLPAAFVTSISTIQLFKYASIQNVEDGSTYRGFVIVKTNASAACSAGFLYWDPATSGLRLLTIATGLDNTLTYDAVTTHRAIVFVGEGWGAKVLRHVKPTVNDGWFEVVDAGCGDTIPNDISIPTDPTGASTAWVSGASPFAGDNVGHVVHNGGYLGSNQGTTTYRIRYRWYDPSRNLFTKISDEHEVTLPTASNSAVGVKILTKDLMTRLTNGFTRLYVYRTIRDGGAYYLEQIVRFSRDYDEAGSKDGDGSVEDVMQSPFILGAGEEWVYVVVGGRATKSIDSQTMHSPVIDNNIGWALGMNDVALNLQRIYDPYYDDAGAFPLGGLLVNHQSMLISNAQVTEDSLDGQGTLRWSSLFSDSPENFPEADHTFRPNSLGSELVGLVSAGDYAFAVRDDTVIRLHRNAGVVAVNELYRKIGGTGRYAMNAVGNVAYVVTAQGLMAIDGTSGRQDVVGAIERLMIDPDDYWRQSLDTVHMGYDAQLGAMALLNTTTEELYWLWTAGAGSVTSLSHVPFQYVAEGPDITTGGNLRTYFVLPSSPTVLILYPDADRSNDIQTMCGATGSDDVNGIVTGTPSVTNFNCTDMAGNSFNPPDTCVGFYLHFITGVNAGLARKITNTGGGNLTVEAFPSAPSAGDYFSVAPIVFDVGFAPLREASVSDLSTRKVLHGMAAFTRDINGEVDPSTNPGFLLEYAASSSLNDSPTFTQIISHATDKTQQWASMEVEGNVLMPRVRQLSSNADFELLMLGFEATIQASEALGPGEGG